MERSNRPLISTSRTLGALAASGLLALLSACGGTDTSSTQSSALSNGTSSADGGFDAAAAQACLTTYAECVRGGTDNGTCRDALRACMPPPGRDHDGDGDGGCDHGPGPGGPPPDGGLPPPDGDGDRPPPPDGGGPGGGPGACLDGLDTCAQGTDAIASCVDHAVACFEALPPPPHGRGGHRPGDDGDGPH